MIKDIRKFVEDRQLSCIFCGRSDTIQATQEGNTTIIQCMLCADNMPLSMIRRLRALRNGNDTRKTLIEICAGIRQDRLDASRGDEYGFETVAKEVKK